MFKSPLCHPEFYTAAPLFLSILSSTPLSNSQLWTTMTEPTAAIDNSAATGAAKQTKPAAEAGLTTLERVHLPRISIKFCTQCRWMLRAAYVCASILSSFLLLLSLRLILLYHSKSVSFGSTVSKLVFSAMIWCVAGYIRLIYCTLNASQIQGG